MPGPLARQVEAVRAELATRPRGLVAHVERVLEEALALAAHWDLDPERVTLAALGHDLFRAYAPAEQLRLAREAGLVMAPADEASPLVLHGPVAAVFLAQRFDVTDEDVLAAVRDHTLGRAAMPAIARVILIADKVEARKRRHHGALREIRALARRDLDAALLCWADHKWVEERTRGWDSHPAHWSARVRWVAEHHADAALPGRVTAEEFDRA